MRFPSAHRLVLLILPLAWMLASCQSTGTHNNTNPEKQAKRASLHYALGLDALQKQNLPKAFSELMEAQKLAPARPDILDALGYAWRLRGNTKKAASFYQQAMKLNPDPATLNNYGSLLLQMKKPALAEKLFHTALDNPRYRHPQIAYINLGDALLAQDHFNKALEAYHHAAMLDPQAVLPQLKEATAYLREHRPAYAKAIYKTILQKTPGNQTAIQGLIKQLRKDGDIAEIRKQLKTFHDHAANPLDKAWAEEELARIIHESP